MLYETNNHHVTVHVATVDTGSIEKLNLHRALHYTIMIALHLRRDTVIEGLG